MTTTPYDDRPSLDDLTRAISALREQYRLAKAQGRITDMISLRKQHDAWMGAYRAMNLMRAEGKDPRDYWGPLR